MARTGARMIATLFVILLLAGLGYGLYQVGVNVGMNVAVQTAIDSGQPVTIVTGGYGHHGGGIGFFGIIFWIIAFFLIIGLIRAAFGWGRGGRGDWGHRSWGHSGYGAGPGMGAFGPRGEQVAEWHRELHRREESGEASHSPSGSASADRPIG